MTRKTNAELCGLIITSKTLGGPKHATCVQVRRSKRPASETLDRSFKDEDVSIGRTQVVESIAGTLT